MPVRDWTRSQDAYRLIRGLLMNMGLSRLLVPSPRLTLFLGMVLSFALPAATAYEPTDPVIEIAQAPENDLSLGETMDDEHCQGPRPGAGGAQPGAAQAGAAPKDERPRLVLNTGGPIGAIWSIAFSQDSSRIFSSGLDKTVQVWGLHAERAIRRNTGNTATLTQTLRWEIARGNRGVVYTIAAAGKGDRVALAGFGARSETGYIFIYDVGAQRVERVLRHHGNTVTSVSFSPRGDQLASLSVDDEVVLWSEPNWEPKVLRAARPTKVDADLDTFPRPLAFLDDRYLVVGQAVDAEKKQWRLARYDVQAPGQVPVVRDQIHAGEVSALARNPHAAGWASADLAGNVFLWDDAQAASPRRLRKQRVALSLAFAPDNRLFVANRIDANKQAVLELWDTRGGELVDQRQTGAAEHNKACAVSPDGTRVATCGGDANELLVMLLADREGKRVEKPLSSGQALRLGGSGQKVWKVAFAADGSRRIAIGTKRKPREAAALNDYGDFSVAFDLGSPNLLRFTREGDPNSIILPAAARKIIRSRRDDDAAGVEKIRWRSIADDAGGWSLSPDPTGQVLQLSLAGQPAGRIVLDPANQKGIRSYCWIPGPDKKPFALAVGVDRGGQGSTGIFVYQLAEKGDCPLRRYYRDHVDWVTSLSVSADGKYLASGSTDQTVKIWSLEGLAAPPGPFTQSVGWGARFEKRGGRIIVDGVLEAGIAARRGLKNGDVVIAAKEKKDGKIVDASDPTRILAILSERPLWAEQVLLLERDGNRIPDVLLVPAWEPIETLFIDRRGEWALWTPQGYYDASVSGDELFGWQINRGLEAKPDFFRADQFRRELEQPALMRNLLASGNVPAALEAAGLAVPENLNSAAGKVGEVASATPIVTILEPRDGIKIGADAEVRVVATVDFPNDQARDRFAIKAYVNGVPGGGAAVQVAGRQRRVEWRVPAPSRFSRVRVIAEEGQEEDAPFAFSDVHVQGPPPAARPEKLKMHVFALAAGDYAGKLRLEFPIADAEGILDRLHRSKGDLYEMGKTRFLKDHEITRDSVASAVAELAGELKSANPEDLLVVFVAGHGIADGADYYFVPPDPSLSEVNEETALDIITPLGVSWKLLRGLADLPCRKVFFLDTCYAGNILLAEGAAENWKNSIRPLGRSEVLVVSATDVNQPAGELKSLAHGIFTKCLLDGLEGKADGIAAARAAGSAPGGDGYIDLLELVKYVEVEVPALSGAKQTPRSTPIELLELILVPLVEHKPLAIR